jgi:hypothetical protein
VDAANSRTNSEAWPASSVTPVAVWPALPFQFTGLRSLAARIPGPVRQSLLALAIYLLVFITVFALPLASHPTVPQLRAYWTDPNFYVWSMRWWPYAITHGLNPLYSTQIGAPAGYSLAWATTTPTAALVMWPVTALFGVIVSYNVMLLTVPPVTALAAFVAARRLTSQFWPSSHFWPALLAGAVYGFTPYELEHDWQGQPNLTINALLPLLVYLIVLWWGGALRNAWFVAAAAVVMALEFYTFDEAFFEMTVILAGGLVLGCAVAGRRRLLKALQLAGLTAIAYAVAVGAALPYLDRLILPSSDKLLGFRPLVAVSNHLGRGSIEDYIGIPLILVLVALVAFSWRSRIAWLLLIGFVCAIALAAGPNLVLKNKAALALPWGGLWNLPLARSAEPSRFIVFAYLILALALALWLTKPAKSLLVTVARWGLGLLAAAALFADLPTSYQAVDPVPPNYHAPATMRPTTQLPAFIADGLYRQYLRPGETVVFITHRGNAAMLFQAATNFYFRIDGGYINASLTPIDATPYQVEAINDPSPFHIKRFKSYVKSAKIGAIIVDRAWAEPWMLTNYDKTGLHGTSVGGVIIYPTGTG